MSAKTGEIDVETVKQKKESIRKYFESESLWWKTKKGPLGLGLYSVAMFYKVLFNHFVLEAPLHDSWSLFQETAVRTVKWSLDAPLAASRRNASFLEGFLKLFKCPEPLTKLHGAHGVRGYWIGPERWEGRYPEAIIMYIHGGGYVAASSLFAVQPLCHLLRGLRKEHKKHVRILSIDYPLAPESQCQEIIDYVEEAYRWLVGESAVRGSDNVMLCGDSAGGAIVLGLLQRICQSEHEKSSQSRSSRPPLILPFGAMLLSPWVNPSTNSASHCTNAKYDYLPVHLLPIAAECYVYGREQGSKKRRQEVPPHKRKAEVENGKRVLDWLEQLQLPNGDWATDVVQPKSKPELLQRRSKERISITSKSPDNPFRDPLISPIYTRRKTLASYPPLFVCYGGKEVFKDDIELFIRRFIKAKKSYSPTNSDSNVNGDVVTSNFSSVRRSAMNGQHPDIEVELGEHMVHDYLVLYEFFGKEARRALKRMTSFVSNKLDVKINHSRQHRRISSPLSPELAPMSALEPQATPVSSPPAPSPPSIRESMAGPAVPPEQILNHDGHNRLSSSVSLPEWSNVTRIKQRSAFSDTSLGGVPNSRRLPSNYFAMINAPVPTNVPVST